MTFFACCVSVALKVLLGGFLCYWVITMKIFCQLYSLYCYQKFSLPVILFRIGTSQGHESQFKPHPQSKILVPLGGVKSKSSFSLESTPGLWWQLNPCYTLMCFWCIILLGDRCCGACWCFGMLAVSTFIHCFCKVLKTAFNPYIYHLLKTFYFKLQKWEPIYFIK